jgi:hypothetical protein
MPGLQHRRELNVELLELLLASTKENLVGTHFQSLSGLVVDSAIAYISGEDFVLPFNPARQIPGGALLDIFEKHFPKKRTTVSVTDIFFEYKHSLGLQAHQQFEVSGLLTNRYAIEIALHRSHQKYGIPIVSPYFQDDYVDKILDPKLVIEKSILSVYSLLGRSPTAREYEKYRTSCDGPSLSYVKEQFDSFNDAKRFAGLDCWEKGHSRAGLGKN